MGIDYLKEAEGFEKKQAFDPSYDGAVLKEATVKNIKYLSDMKGSGKLIGMELYEVGEQSLTDFIEGLKLGFAAGEEQKRYDYEESKKIQEGLSALIDKQKGQL